MNRIATVAVGVALTACKAEGPRVDSSSSDLCNLVSNFQQETLPKIEDIRQELAMLEAVFGVNGGGEYENALSFLSDCLAKNPRAQTIGDLDVGDALQMAKASEVVFSSRVMLAELLAFVSKE